MQKTTNYNLKKPEVTDPLRVADFNENADIVDAALGALSASGYAVGSYTGTGAAITINLGFRPSFVMINGLSDEISSLSIKEFGCYCAVTAGKTVNINIVFTDTGFTVKPDSSTGIQYPNLTGSGRAYDYIAFR